MEHSIDYLYIYIRYLSSNYDIDQLLSTPYTSSSLGYWNYMEAVKQRNTLESPILPQHRVTYLQTRTLAGSGELLVAVDHARFS